MNYWITTQWPLRPLQLPRPSYGVYVRAQHVGVLADMRPGDLVFFYESKTGRALRRKDPDGAEIVLRCGIGRREVIKLARVIGQVGESKETPQEYEDGSNGWWRYHAKVEVIDDTGFVTLAELNKILGYQPVRRLRAFWDKNSGVKKLDKAMFDAIERALKANTQ